MQARTPQSSPPAAPSEPKAGAYFGWQVALFLVSAIAVVFLLGAGLSAAGRLPLFLQRFAQNVLVIVSTIGAVLVAAGGGLLIRLSESWKHIEHRWLASACGGAAGLIILVASVGIVNDINGVNGRLQPPGPSVSITSTGGNSTLVASPVPSATATVTATPIPPTSTVSGLPTLLSESAPMCSSPSLANWQKPASGTPSVLNCATAYADLTQGSGLAYGEEDLISVHGNGYAQQPLELRITAQFLQPSNTLTRAAFLMETPAASGQCGGYAFAITASGSTELQSFAGCQQFPQTTSGNAMHFDPTQPVSIDVSVANGTLLAVVNGQSAGSWNITIPTYPTRIGIMVEQDSQPSATIRFSNLTLLGTSST